MEPADHRKTAELLADWRAAGRDAVAARAAANVAALALDAATAAEEAADEVEAAAKSALDAVERARNAVAKAKVAAERAAEAAHLILSGATGDKAKANHDVEVAERAEREAGDAFHRAEGAAMDDAKREGYAETDS